MAPGFVIDCTLQKVYIEKPKMTDEEEQRQKCMETKNSILARQKEMQTSLEKVKHLVRLIHSFNLTQPSEVETSQDGGGENRSDEPQEPKDAVHVCAKPPGSEQNPTHLAAPVPPAGMVPEVQVEPEVGEMAESTTAVTPEAESGESGVTDAQPSEDVAAPNTSEHAEVTEVSTNGATDSQSPGPIQKEAVSPVNGADSEKTPPGASNGSTEAETEAEQPKDTDHGGGSSSSNNGKTSEPSQQLSPAPVHKEENVS